MKGGQPTILDDEGVDLPDFSAARLEALLSARELLSEAIKSGTPEVPDAFVIVDDAGQTLGTVLLTDVLPKSMKSRH
jgi:hypothetical protein